MNELMNVAVVNSMIGFGPLIFGGVREATGSYTPLLVCSSTLFRTLRHRPSYNDRIYFMQ
jgi:hypothetical protein